MYVWLCDYPFVEHGMNFNWVTFFFFSSGVYNGIDHIPKLLPCSHTVCLGCLNRIADVRSREIGVFRCPICRELTNIPQGGISALPPSFLVNRLLDLMSRQRRQIVPTCSDHSNQVIITVLMFQFTKWYYYVVLYFRYYTRVKHVTLYSVPCVKTALVINQPTKIVKLANIPLFLIP